MASNKKVNYSMKNGSRAWLIFVVVVLFSGCVSKKKYLAMETLKNQYVRQTNTLDKENETLKSDLDNAEKEYEEMQQELRFSDKKKEEDISRLSVKLKEVESNFNRAQTELSRTKDLYKDQRYYNTQASNEITRLQFAVEQLKRDTVSLNYSLELARRRNVEIQEKLSERVDQLNDKSATIAKERNEVAAKIKTIERLEKDVKVQNEKIESISVSFIELRKEMLRAKANNEVLDPATEPNVAKISKALGHY